MLEAGVVDKQTAQTSSSRRVSSVSYPHLTMAGSIMMRCYPYAVLFTGSKLPRGPQLSQQESSN